MRQEVEVVYQLVEDGCIMARAPAVPGAITQGRNLAEARRNIIEAVGLLLAVHREESAQEAAEDAILELLAVAAPG